LMAFGMVVSGGLLKKSADEKPHRTPTL